jgi:hypothetical protein
VLLNVQLSKLFTGLATNFIIAEQVVAPNSGFQPILLALPIVIFIVVLVVGVILYKRRKKVSDSHD